MAARPHTRAYPVTIDPEVLAGDQTAAFDAFVSSLATTTTYDTYSAGGHYLNLIGKITYPVAAEYRTFQRFDLADLTGTEIASASWHALVFDHNGSAPIILHPNAAAFSATPARAPQ